MDETKERRARLVQRQLRAASATTAAQNVVALHATDPATVYLSALARCPTLTVGDVAREMYDERRLVRMMGMRRTLFVVPADLVPLVHAAAALDVAATMRRRLLKELATLPTDPPLPQDVAGWLAGVETGVMDAIERLGVASGAELGKAEPRLRTAVLPTTSKKYDVRRTLTSQVLVLMGAEGRLVRGQPMGTWTSRQHTWQAASAWWSDGIAPLEPEDARARLVAAYLHRFGPATENDIVWWTGWAKGKTRHALAALNTVEWAGGLVHAGDAEPTEDSAPTAALLPALDPTPMGWKERDWFLPPDHRELYDSFGNIGPTVWWGGEVIGGWATRPDGSVATQLLTDRGSEAAQAVDAAAEELARRLGGTVVVPSFRTPLERQLSDVDPTSGAVTRAAGPSSASQ